MAGLLRLFRTTFRAWSDDRASKMAAALAYYAAFAVAPLLLIAVAVAGLAYGRDAAEGQLVGQLAGFVGEEGARAIQGILRRAWKPREGVVATALGLLALAFAASGVFAELQDSLNLIWKVRKKPGRGVVGTLVDRFCSFTLVVGIGFLLLVSLLVDTGLQAVTAYVSDLGGAGPLLKALSAAASFVVITLIFAAMFRVLPDAKTRWRDLFPGAAFTALLFTVGKYLIGLYLGTTTIGSTYGAAGSFVIFLLWVNYSSQIVFLGAEFTRHYAIAYGAIPVPRGKALLLEPRLKPRGRRAIAARRGRRSGLAARRG
jgi:membrane protein